MKMKNMKMSSGCLYNIVVFITRSEKAARFRGDRTRSHREVPLEEEEDEEEQVRRRGGRGAVKQRGTRSCCTAGCSSSGCRSRAPEPSQNEDGPSSHTSGARTPPRWQPGAGSSAGRSHLGGLHVCVLDMYVLVCVCRCVCRCVYMC